MNPRIRTDGTMAIGGSAPQETHLSNGGRLVGVHGQELPLRSVSLTGDAGGGVARVTVAQTFANIHAEPLEVTYTMPLPADGAVAGYTVRIGEKVIRGTIDTREAARETFERAIVEGRTAGLVDQERANVFTQRLGNVPPGTQVVVELTVDQRLSWLAGGFWEWRFPTVVAPRYMGAEGRVPDAGKVTVDVASAPLAVRATVALRIGDALREGGSPESPSHDITFEGGTATLPAEGARLDRDIVIQWPVGAEDEGIRLVTARPVEGAPHAAGAYGLLTIVPPAVERAGLTRDLIVLIDTSGSMDGRPLEKAKEIVGALIDTLGDTDRLELIAFGSEPRRWEPGALAGTSANRRKARSWVGALEAGGGTEMTSAMLEALRPLRPDSVRQVVLVTDGEIGFEREILRTVHAGLPAGCRVHTVGIGGSVNRALTRPVARAGRGREVLVDLDESVSRASRRLVEATRNPVLVDLEIDGDAVAGVAPGRPSDLMAGMPVLVGLKLSPAGGGLVVRGRSVEGPWERRLTVPPTDHGHGDGIATNLYGREAVEDLETGPTGGRGRAVVDKEVVRLGLEFGIATRLTSWVAVSEEPTVDPRQPVRTTRIPQELPYGMSAEGLGLRPPMFMAQRMESADRDAILAENMSFKRMMSLESPRSRYGLAGPFGAGRWAARLDEGRRFLEIEVLHGVLSWRPEDDIEVVLRLADGSQKTVALDTRRSTERGMIGKGMILRLLLEVDEEAVNQTVAIDLVLDGERLSIRM